MEICLDYKQCIRDARTVLTVGTFDGVHVGHKKIIEMLTRRARELNCRSCLITFKPHPQLVVKKIGKKDIRILTVLKEKIEILKNFNIDLLSVIPFNKEFSNLIAQQFVEEILIDAIGLKEIIVGHDHAFGKDRSGSIEQLKELGGKWNFGVTVVPPLLDGGMPVSSTRIRRLIQEGNMEQVHRYLGRPYQLTGKVVPGNARGRNMNYPTANIVPEDPDKLLVSDGLYVCEVKIQKRLYKGIVNIGYRPTFQGKKHTIEIYILDFNKNIYGEIVTIYFLHFLREEIRFDSSEKLTTQMNKDLDDTLTYFAGKPVIETLL